MVRSTSICKKQSKKKQKKTSTEVKNILAYTRTCILYLWYQHKFTHNINRSSQEKRNELSVRTSINTHTQTQSYGACVWYDEYVIYCMYIQCKYYSVLPFLTIVSESHRRTVISNTNIINGCNTDCPRKA